MSLPCLSLALAVAPTASAISIRDDVSVTNYETQLSTSPYSASGQFDVFLTGTLITSEWVLTAAHGNTPSTFTASDGTVRTVVERVVYPGDAAQGDADDGADFALIRLSAPINSVPTATLHDPVASAVSYADLLGDIGGLTAVYTGSGKSGDGDSGAAGTRNLIAGNNVIDFVGVNTGTPQNPIIIENMAFSEFNNHDSDPSTALEMGLSEGDSGGGLWVDLGDGQVLIGVHSVVYDAPNGVGTYGQLNGSTVITDDVYAWINSTVPEPSSLALLGLGGLMMARRRR